MNKLGTSLMLVGIVGMLGLPACASKDAPGEEATSGSGDSLSTPTPGREQVLTVEEFIRSGGQPLTTVGDTSDGTTIRYECPKLVLTPSATINENVVYSSWQGKQATVTQEPNDTVYAKQTTVWMEKLNDRGPWYQTRHIACGVGMGATGPNGNSQNDLLFNKRFSTLHLCQFYKEPGVPHYGFLCKGAPSPM